MGQNGAQESTGGTSEIGERRGRRERGGGNRNLRLCPTPSGTATVGSEQRLSLRLLTRNGRQRKRPHPGVSDTGSAAAASHPAEQTCDRGDGISISPDGTRRKGKLAQTVRK